MSDEADSARPSTAEVAAKIQRMREIPDKVKAVFRAENIRGNGITSIEAVTAIFQGAGGPEWTEERVRDIVKAAGGSDGQIAMDALLAWVFDGHGPECQPPPEEPCELEEPCSPKIGRKRKDKKKSVDPWSDVPEEGLGDQAAPSPDAKGDSDEDPTSPLPMTKRLSRKEVQDDPTSPLAYDDEPIMGHRMSKKEVRAMAEKSAEVYYPKPGEELYVPASHQHGVLLLRPDGSFAYIHDLHAKFSEGVKGDWVEEPEGKVTLTPTDFGWCYQESFDPEEIIGVEPTVTLCRDEAMTNDRRPCVLPEEFQTRFSWMDPTLPEP